MPRALRAVLHAVRAAPHPVPHVVRTVPHAVPHVVRAVPAGQLDPHRGGTLPCQSAQDQPSTSVPQHQANGGHVRLVSKPSNF